MTMNNELKGYIERAVPDIARKCGLRDDEVWLAVYNISIQHKK